MCRLGKVWFCVAPCVPVCGRLSEGWWYAVTGHICVAMANLLCCTETCCFIVLFFHVLSFQRKLIYQTLNWRCVFINLLCRSVWLGLGTRSRTHFPHGSIVQSHNPTALASSPQVSQRPPCWNGGNWKGKATSERQYRWWVMFLFHFKSRQFLYFQFVFHLHSVSSPFFYLFIYLFIRRSVLYRSVKLMKTSEDGGNNRNRRESRWVWCVCVCVCVCTEDCCFSWGWMRSCCKMSRLCDQSQRFPLMMSWRFCFH